MTTYRVYLVDERRHIKDVREVADCESDETALERAKQFVDGHAVEVWDHSRFIGFIGRDRKIVQG